MNKRTSSVISQANLLIINHIIMTIDNYQKENNYDHPIEFNIPREDYFNLMLSMKAKKKTAEYIHLLHGYLLLLNDFVKKIKSQHDEEKFPAVLYGVILGLQYEFWPQNRLMIKMGNPGSKYYIILSGTVEVLIPSERIEALNEQKYLRYLAKLISYDEFELFNMVNAANASVYPIDLNTDGLQGLLADKITKPELSIKLNRRITIKELLSYLTVKEKNEFYARVNQENKDTIRKNKDGNADNGIVMTSQDYFDRLNNYNLLKRTKKKESNEMITVTLMNYVKICTLQTGQQFGESALSDPLCKRTATLITTSDCHFCWLNKSTYKFLIKTANEKMKHQTLNFILSLNAFHGFSLKRLQVKYFNSFVINKVIKNDKILPEKGQSDNIIILKQGLFDLTINQSLAEIGETIDYIFNESIENNFNNTEEEEEEEDKMYLIHEIQEMREENRKITNGLKEMESISKFYHQKRLIKVWMINSPDTLGFSELGYSNDTSIYEIKCCSNEGEVITLPKAIYEQMCSFDFTLKSHKKKLCYEKNIKLVERLISIRKLTLSSYFAKHNINKFLYLDHYNTKSKDIIVSDAFSKSKSQKKLVNLHLAVANRLSEINAKQMKDERREIKKKTKKITTKSSASNISSLNWKNRSQSSRNLNRNTSLYLLPNKTKEQITDRVMENRKLPICTSNNHKNSEPKIITNSMSSKLSNSHSKQLTLPSNIPLTMRNRNRSNQTSKNYNLNNHNVNSTNSNKTIYEYSYLLARPKKEFPGKRSVSVLNLNAENCYSKTNDNYDYTHANEYITQRNRQVINTTRSVFLRFKDKLLFTLVDKKK